MIKYLAQVKILIARFTWCTILLVSREDNAQANALAKLASTSDMKLPRAVNVFPLPESSASEELATFIIIPKYGPDPETWMTPIIEFLQNGTLPQDKNASLKIRRQSPRYLLINRVLYSQGFLLPYLRCVAPPQTDQILQKVHGGTCGSHSKGTNLGHPITR